MFRRHLILLAWNLLTVAWPAVARASLPADDLESTAVHFLEFLGTDPEQQAKGGERMVEAWMDGKAPERALRTLDRFATWKQVQVSYWLVEGLVKAGKTEDARRIHEAALKKSQGVLDFEKDEIGGARAVAWGAMGDAPQGIKNAEAIPGSLVRHEALAELVRFLPPGDAVAIARKLVGDQTASNSLKGLALTHAARVCVDSDPKQATDLALEAAQELVRRVDPETVRRLCAVVRILNETGKREEAERWIEVAKGIADRLDRRAYWVTRDLVEIGRTYEILGMKEKAQAIERDLPNLIGGQGDAGAYARSAMDVADIFAARGELDKFHKAAVHVLQQSSGYTHHRARARGGLEVVATYARHAIVPDVRVQEELTALMDSIRKDPYYRPTR